MITVFVEATAILERAMVVPNLFVYVVIFFAAFTPCSALLAQRLDNPESIAMLKKAGATLFLGQNGQVERVYFTGPSINDDATRGLRGLHSVTKLSFAGSHITDKSFKNFSHLAELQYLYITWLWYVPGPDDVRKPVVENRLAITSKGFEHLTNSKLRVLDVTGTEIDDSVIETILQFKHLERLELLGNAMSGEGLRKLRDGLPKEVDVRMPGEGSF